MQAITLFFSHTATIVLSVMVGLASYFHPVHKTIMVTQPPLIPRVTQATSTQVLPATTTKPLAITVGKSSSKIASSSPTVFKPVPIPAPKPITPIPPITQPAPTPNTPTVSIEDINTKLRESLVNILCTTKAGGSFRPISGSGLIIDTRGIILTNAHVAQFFLLKDYPYPNNVTCVVRTGSPAMAKYNARILYVPEAWIHDNAAQLKNMEAVGTGENDYAFLEITSAIDGSPLASHFSAPTLSLDEPEVGDLAVIAAYPAQFLGGTSIQMNLYASSAVTPIQNVYTFDTGTIDVLSVGNTMVSQSGSSGGTVARIKDGAVIGVISTATEGTTTSTRDLRAITLAHVDRSLRSHGKGGLVQFLLDGGLDQKANDFNANIAPSLTKLLTDVLSH